MKVMSAALEAHSSRGEIAASRREKDEKYNVEKAVTLERYGERALLYCLASSKDNMRGDQQPQQYRMIFFFSLASEKAFLWRPGENAL